MQTPRGREAESQRGAGGGEQPGAAGNAQPRSSPAGSTCVRWAQPWGWAGAARTPDLPSHPLPMRCSRARQGRGAGSMPGRDEAGSAGRCGPSVLGNTRAVARVMRLPQGRGSHPGHFCPAGKPPAGEAREGSAGVCSGRNRASIDLLLLKPELLSGTLQPGCPRVCFLERAILRAFAGGGRSPQSTWPRHWPTPGSGAS